MSFRLLNGRRIALIGGNGVGKTTLLEIIVGLGEPDEGEVHRSKDLRVGYLPQELTELATGTVLEEVLAGADGIADLERELAELAHRMADPAEADHDRVVAAYGEAQARFQQMGGYAIEAEARRLLGGLGFDTEDMDRPLAEMSGGWRMRAALARLMLAEPDVLVLDEPTNHLDTDSVAWLESQLAAWPGAILFVSHDRDFIDSVAERVIEIVGGTAHTYVGGFAEFVVQREERLATLRNRAANQARAIADTERFIERFRYKASKAKQVQSRVKTLSKLERIEAPDHRTNVARFDFGLPRRSSRVVVELHDATVGYDDTAVLRAVDLVVERGEKWAVVGPNGAGKSTLLKTIMGRLAPIEGTCQLGTNVDIAYFAQHQVDALDLNTTVEREFRRAVGDQPKNRNLRTVLGSFGFSGEAVDRLVGDCSGGERTRLALAEIMCNPVNLLVLDEPTNHLDLPSCDVLEDALDAYPGTVLLVSHDRHLVRNTVAGLIEVRDGRVRVYRDVDESVLSPRSVSAAGGSSKPSASLATPSSPPGRSGTAKARATQRRTEAVQRQTTYRAAKDLKKRVTAAERQIATTESKIADIQRQLADPATYDDREAVVALTAEHDRLKDRALDLMAEWEEAQSRLDAAGE